MTTNYLETNDDVVNKYVDTNINNISSIQSFLTTDGIQLVTDYTANIGYRYLAGLNYWAGYQVGGVIITNEPYLSNYIGSIVGGENSRPDKAWRLISCGYNHGLVISQTDELMLWGANDSGQLGANFTSQYSTGLSSRGTGWRYAAAVGASTAAIKTNGTLWMWGRNIKGVLGLGNTISVSSPVQVGSLTNWKYISGGGSTYAIKTDNTLWSWGENNYGQLGHNDTSDRSSPVQVGNQSDWRSVSGGIQGAIAIKTDGSLWAWGFNFNGRLGLNSTANISSPTQIGTDKVWRQAVMSEASYAIKQDGTLWSWGDNTYGQLGHNSRVHRSSPVQVGTLATWRTISSVYRAAAAINNSDQLWTWGGNFEGELAIGWQTQPSAFRYTWQHRSAPTQVGGFNTNWRTASMGQNVLGALRSTYW